MSATARDPDSPGSDCGSELVGGAQLIAAAVEPAATGVDDLRAPLRVDERARGEPWQPPPLVIAELADQSEAGEQLVLVRAGDP